MVRRDDNQMNQKKQSALCNFQMVVHSYPQGYFRLGGEEPVLEPRQKSKQQPDTYRLGDSSLGKERAAQGPHSKDELGRPRESGESPQSLENKGTLSLGHSNPGPTLGQTRLPGFRRNPVARKKRTQEA